MLNELRIQDFAIIDTLEVQLTPGFNVITGETGAGKSIIIDAVDMVLGGRADSDFIRSGREKAVVEAVFKLSPASRADFRPLFEAEGIELSADGELTLTRELRANGRNVCRVNGSTVNLQFYRDLGQRLVDVHGQGEHLSLLRPREHIYLLDRFANLDVSRANLAAIVQDWVEVRHEIEQLVNDEAAIARRIDMLNYQIEEIRAVNPRIGEEEELQAESALLANAEQLATLTGESLQLLDGDEAEGVSAVAMLGQVAVALGKLLKIDPQLADDVSLAETIAVQAEELSRNLRHYADRIEHNPARLYEVEERMDALTRLKRKYGGTIEAVIAFGQKAAEDLSKLTNSEDRLRELRTQEDVLLRQIGERAAQISKARKAAADKLGEGIVRELADLKMEGSRFGVDIQQVEDPNGCYVGEQRLRFDHTGIDTVEFMLAANRGEPLRPLVKVASGGETARIMLALKTVLSRADSTPTLIFDEIDQGIGGRVGSIVGQKLWKLSEGHQVLCVTHLPQIAAFGDSHFRVVKSQREDRTVTSITSLNDRARVDELAEMLGAETGSGKQSAHDLLMVSRGVKEGKNIQTTLFSGTYEG